MPTNGSGTYSRPVGTTAVSGASISSSSYNDFITDLETALTARLNTSGTKAWAANQSVGGFKFTSLGDGTSSGDAANLGQVQKSTFNWADTGGTADIITATFTPTVTSYTNGMRLRLRASSANTATAPTFNADGVGAKKIYKAAGAALVAGDIAGDNHELDLTYNTALDSSAGGWQLANPQSTQSVNIVGQTALTAVATDDSLLIYDLSATTNKSITVANLFGVTNGWTEDTTPDAAADYVTTWDASASAAKKVLLKNLRPLTFWEYAIGDESTAVTTGTAKITVRAPHAMTVTNVRASATTAGAGAITLDLNESGTSIISTKLSMDATEKTSTTAATPHVLSDTAIADDAELTVDVDAVSGTWAGVKVRFYGYPA